MPISACSSGLVVVTAVLTLLLPAQYYLPELYPRTAPPPPRAPHVPHAAPRTAAAGSAWPAIDLAHFPTLDLVFTVSLIFVGLFTYLCEWIQRKLMERRILKLNQYLCASVERLRAWDAQQEQLEATLRMVQNATSEYNLLLFLLLRQHRCLHPATPPHPAHGAPAPADAAPLPAAAPPLANCFFDKELDDDFSFLRNAPTLGV